MEKAASFSEAAARHPGTAASIALEPARTVRFRHWYALNSPAFAERQLAFDFPEIHLWQLNRQWAVWSESGLVFDPAGRPVVNALSFPDPVQLDVHLKKAAAAGRPERHRHVDGALFVFTNTGGRNYFHVLTELIPRLVAVRHLLPENCTLLIPGTMPFTRELLERSAGHLPYLTVEPDVLYTADSLYATDWALNFIPERYAQAAAMYPGIEKNGSRLYIARRSGERTLENEEQVEAVFKNAGFDILRAEVHAVADQAALFSRAGVVAGAHGAGFANLIWAGGVPVLELRPAGWDNRSIYHHALASGCRRYAVLEEAATGPGQRMTVDILRLERVLEALLR